MLLIWAGYGAVVDAPPPPPPPPVIGDSGGISSGRIPITLGQSYTRHELEALGLTEEEILQLLAMGWLLLT